MSVPILAETGGVTLPTQPMPVIFVPGAPAADPEAAHAALAGIAGHAAPAGERISSITFRHNGEAWTAMVGERLVGRAWKRVGRPRVQHLADPVRVLAIFAGHPFTVVLDGARSAGANPFCAGDVRLIVPFALDDA